MALGLSCRKGFFFNLKVETKNKNTLPLNLESTFIDRFVLFRYGTIIHGGALEPDRIKYVSINNSLVKLGYAYKTPKPKAAEQETSTIKKASNGDDLLKVAKVNIDKNKLELTCILCVCN